MSAVGAAGRASGLAPGDGPPGAAGSVVDAVAGLGLDGPGVARAPRTAAAEDCSDRGPAGCTLRMYTSGEAPCWKGELSGTVLDPAGRHTRSRRWGFYSGRSQDEAYEDVFDWLWEHGASGGAAPSVAMA